MHKKRYQTILFDLDNTLINYDQCEHASMTRALKDHGLWEINGFSWEVFRTAFSPINFKYWSERRQNGLNIHQILEFSFRDTLMEIQIDLDTSTSKPISESYWNYFCQSYHFESGADQLLSDLHLKYKLGIITNGVGDAQRRRLKAGQIDHYFDTLIMSDEVGLWKPDTEIFKLALDQLDCTHQKALYVGDSIEDDYQGALRSGIDFCLYNPHKKPLGNEIKPAHEIHQLQELNRLLLG